MEPESPVSPALANRLFSTSTTWEVQTLCRNPKSNGLGLFLRGQRRAKSSASRHQDGSMRLRGSGFSNGLSSSEILNDTVSTSVAQVASRTTEKIRLVFHHMRQVTEITITVSSHWSQAKLNVSACTAEFPAFTMRPILNTQPKVQGLDLFLSPPLWLLETHLRNLSREWCHNRSLKKKLKSTSSFRRTGKSGWCPGTGDVLLRPRTTQEHTFGICKMTRKLDRGYKSEEATRMPLHT